MGTQPVHHITNLQTMCQANFQIWLTVNHKQHRTQSSAKFNGSRISLSDLPCVYQNTSVQSLLHDSSGLPYVKDRLLSCATRALERISKNPLVEESITFNRGQSCVGSFSNTALCNPSGQSID